MQTSTSFPMTLKEEKQFEELLSKYGVVKKIDKGVKIIKEGEKSDFFFFVVRGGFKSYISKGDREFILGFSFNENVDCCPYSFFSSQKNTYTLEAYVDSEIIKVRMSDLEKFVLEEDGFENFIKKSLVNYIGNIETTLFDLTSKTAEERYIDLIENYKNYIELISLSDIAKYLGVTLERLSRIRKKMKVK
jgi:CRP/FNR family transcriptional regulator, anaerobic regulatory protein